MMPEGTQECPAESTHSVAKLPARVRKENEPWHLLLLIVYERVKAQHSATSGYGALSPPRSSCASVIESSSSDLGCLLVSTWHYTLSQTYNMHPSLCRHDTFISHACSWWQRDYLAAKLQCGTSTSWAMHMHSLTPWQRTLIRALHGTTQSPHMPQLTQAVPST